MDRNLKALALVAIMSIAAFSPAWLAPDTGIVEGATLGTFSNGAPSVNITFMGPGENSTAAALRLPARVNVSSASVQLRGSAVEREGSVTNSTDQDFGTGAAEKVTIGNGGVRLELANLTWTSTTDTDFAGETKRNVDISNGAVTNNMSGWMGNYRIDPTGNAVNTRVSSMAIASNGTIFASWGDSRGHGWGGFPTSLFLARSEDHGNNFRNETLIWSTATQNIMENALLVDGNGIVHIVFSYDNGASQPQTINYSRSTDGGRTFSQSITIGKGASPSMAIGPDNRIFVAYTNFTTVPATDNMIFVNSSADGGLTWGGPFRVDGGVGKATYPDIAVGSGGKVHVAWYDTRSGPANPYYANSTDNGITFSPDRPITTNTIDSRPKLATYSTTLHMVWAEAQKPRYTRTTDGGSSFASPITVPMVGGTQYNPVVAMGPTGRVHVAWENFDGMATHPFYTTSSDGVTFGQAKRVDDAVSGSQTDYTLRVDKRDNAHMIWTDTRNGFSDIWYSRFPPVGMVISTPKDLGSVPMALVNFSIAASVPAGTEVVGMLHSSSNNQDWTDWEQVDNNDDNITTKPDRYLQWAIFLWANVSAAPTVYDVNVTYKVGRMNGTFTSAPTEIGALLSMRAYWNATMNGQDLDIQVSADNGTTWKLAGQVGGLVTFTGAGAGTTLRYRVLFLSTVQGASAVLEDITIEYRTSELTTDPKLIVSGEGAPDWTFPGPFEGMELVTGFDEKLTGYLATAAPDMDGFVTVPLKFTSKSAGAIELRSLNIKYSAPPDMPTLSSPANGSVISTHTPRFEMSASEPDGDSMIFRVEVMKAGQATPVAIFDQSQEVLNGNWSASSFSPGETAIFTPSEAFGIADGVLEWRALAFDGSFWSKPSALSVLIIDTVPPEGTVTDDGAETDSRGELDISFQFTDASSGIALYEYFIGTAPGDNDTLTTTTASDPTITATGLELSPGGTYYISARAQDRAGLWSGWAVSDGIKVRGQGPTAGLSYPDGVQAATAIQLQMDVKDPMGGRVDDVDLEWSSAQYANATAGNWSGWADVGGASGGDSMVRSFEGMRGNVYRFRARAHNDQGIWGIYEAPSSTIRIDRPPVIGTGQAEMEVKAGDTLDLNASGLDEDGDPLDFTWYFPDDESTQSGQNVSHRFEDGGDFEVKVTVSDGTMNATSTILVKVEGKKGSTGKVPALTAPLAVMALAAAAIIAIGKRRS